MDALVAYEIENYQTDKAMGDKSKLPSDYLVEPDNACLLYTSVRVRGIASMNASTEPLYVLDGVPVASRDMSGLSANTSAGGLGLIETLNPADIESITVLKDAASASLYGAKGSNGVIPVSYTHLRQGRKQI